MSSGKWLVVAIGLSVAVLPGGASAQVVAARDTIGLSLAEALDRSIERSEEVRIAQAQVDRARAQVGSARSNLLPQVNTQLGYTRTLRSVFQGGGFEIPDSLRFDPDSTASTAERLRYLEQNTPNAAFEALGGLFSGLPFGQEHTPHAERLRYLEAHTPHAAFGALGGLFGGLPSGEEHRWNASATLQQALFAPAAVSGVQLARRAAEAARASYEEAVSDVTLQVTEA